MKYRVRFVHLVLLVALALVLTSCSAPTPTTTPTAGGPTATGPVVKGPVEIDVVRSTNMSQSYSDAVFVDFVKQKFDLTLKYSYYPSSSFLEKLSLSFATDSYGDMMEIVDIATINRYAKDGFILPLNDYLDTRLTNYRKAYSDQDWAYLLASQTDALGKLFALPVRMASGSTGSNVFFFRSAQFEKAGVKVPTTVEELYDGLMAIKTKINPKVTMPNQWGLANVYSGFDCAFRTQNGIWKDPDADGQLVYGPVTDKFRKLLQYLNKLYESDLLAKEFSTMSDQQFWSEYAAGNTYVCWRFPGFQKRLNGILQAAKIDPDWEFDTGNLLLSAYPDKGPLQQRYGTFYSSGVALTNKLEPAELDRVLDYLDWSSTEEGQVFHEYGVEGKTYEMKDGIPTFIGEYSDATESNPAGSYYGKLQDYGPFGYFLVENEAHAERVYPDYKISNEALKKFESMDLFIPIPYRFTPTQETRQAELFVVVDSVSKEYQLSFIVGEKDPNSDADWNEFIAKMNAAGLEEYMTILRAANALTR
jgi:putative aldouronate transport system substrate-binding protein